MLLSSARRRLNSTGALRLPGELRDLAHRDEPGLVVATDLFGPALHVYSMVRWRAFERKLDELPPIPEAGRFRRLYVVGAHDSVPDQRGTLRLAPRHQDWLKLEDGEVTVLRYGEAAMILASQKWKE